MSAESRSHEGVPGLATSAAEDNGDVHQEMMEMILSFWVTQTLRAVADLSLADHLAGGGLTAAEIAE